VKKFKLWAGLFALFCSGVLVGGLATWHIAEFKAFESLIRERPRAPKFIMRKLDRELRLNDTQRKRIEAIICRTHQELLAVRDRLRPDRERILQQSIDAMKAELTPEQQKKLDELHERLKAHRSRGEIGHEGVPGEKDPCE
jgi:hypothetical protein